MLRTEREVEVEYKAIVKKICCIAKLLIQQLLSILSEGNSVINLEVFVKA